MASISKKTNGMWFAQVRHRATDGLPAINRSASFPRKVEAEAWANKIETDWRTMRFGGCPNILFSEVLLRYQKEVSVKKRGYRYEANLFDRILTLPLADVRLPNLSEMHFRQWADQRLKEVKSSSVRREWNVLSNVLTYASTEWRLIPENFMLRLEKPPGAPARTQRISNQVAKQIAYAANYSLMCTPDTATQRAAAAFYFALETAMRAGEICSLSWDNVFLKENYVHLPRTKNGHPRDVPLSRRAKTIIRQMQQVKKNNQVFNLTRSSLDALFRKLKQRSLLQNTIRFHDSRREALTRLAKIYGVMDLAKISGHRDTRILLNTYYSPTAKELAAKMHASN